MDARTARQLIQPFYAQYCYKNDKSYTLTENSDELALFLGYEKNELDGASICSLIADPLREEICMKITRQISERGETGTFLPLTNKGGEVVWVFCIGRLISDECGKEYVYGIFAQAECAREVNNFRIEQLEEFKIKLSKTENMVSMLQIKAEQDTMTGLFNSGTTKALVKEFISSYHSRPCAMLIIDVDDFKRINDCYGHMVGDKVMIRAAETIKKLFRANDIVGRIGGDEFLVFMKDVPDRRIVEVRCSQIVESFRTITCDEIHEGVLSCSVGAAFSSDHDNHYDPLFCAADKEMYRAKSMGGNRYFIEETH